MATTPKNTDRRVQRTQQLLKQAFIEALNEKGFAALSIQDITDRANVNRGTFYAHFTDKYALLEAAISEKMQQAMHEMLPLVSQWDQSTLHSFIRRVLDCIVGPDSYVHDSEQVVPRLLAQAALESGIFERAVHEGLVELLLKGLKLTVKGRPQVPLETIAHIMSWTIVGAAMQHYQMSPTISSEEMADAVLLVVMKGVEQLTMIDNASN